MFMMLGHEFFFLQITRKTLQSSPVRAKCRDVSVRSKFDSSSAFMSFYIEPCLTGSRTQLVKPYGNLDLGQHWLR